MLWLISVKQGLIFGAGIFWGLINQDLRKAIEFWRKKTHKDAEQYSGYKITDFHYKTNG